MAQVRSHSFSCLALLASSLLGGCGVAPRVVTPASGAVGFSGSVHGGQQAVVGAAIQLYGVGTTVDGGAATPLLAPGSVMSDGSGNFNFLPSAYSCTGVSDVYLTATGGNPSPSGANPNLALLVAIGPCSSLTANTFVSVNELTTVAAVNTLAPYMTSLTAVGSTPAHAAALDAAFSVAGEFVDPATGLTPGQNVPSGYSVPTVQIDTLGDILASCVNSTGGVASNTSTPCGYLFSLTTPPSGSAPTETVGALLNLANNPTLNTQALASIPSPAAPFQPTLTATPPDFRVRLTAPASAMALQISPGSLMLAATTVGSTSAAQAVTIMNASAAAVTFTGIAITGNNAADFAQTNNCGASLAASASCTVQVSFAPAAGGPRVGYLSIASGAPDSPQYVALAGSATAGVPKAVFGAVSLAFSVPGFSKDVSLTNAGTGYLSITSLSTYTVNFSATNHCGAGLAAGASCTITITNQSPGQGRLYQPRAQYDALTLVSNDPVANAGVALSSFNLYGLTVSNINFPGTPAGTTATTSFSYVVHSNSPCIAPSNSGPITFGAGTSTQDYDNLTYTYYTLCSFPVSYTPTTLGTQTARMTLSTNGEYGLVSATRVTSAGSSSVTVTPANLSLRNSTPGSFTLSNFTSNAFAIQSITPTAGFTQTNSCGSALAAQSACTITVAALSSNLPGIQGGVVIVDDLGTQTGQATATFDNILDFGSSIVGVKGPVRYPFSIGSAGGPSAAGFNSDGPDFSSDSCFSRFQGCTGYGTFIPTASGTRTTTGSGSAVAGTTQIMENFRVTGFAVASSPLISFDPYDFLQTQVGKSIGEPATVPGMSTFNIHFYYTSSDSSSVTFTGPNAADFSAAPCSSPGGVTDCSLNLTFSPSGQGLRTAILNVKDTSSGKTFTLPVAGQGTYPAPVLSVPNYSFAPIPAGTTEGPASFTATTPNADALTLTLGGSSPSQFTLSTTSCAQGQSSCAFTVTFKPTASSSSPNATITVLDTATGLSSMLTVYGSTPPNATASTNPTSLTFAPRAVGSTSVNLTVTLSTSGPDPLYLSSIALGGSNASDFTLNNSCPTSLAANTSCTFTVNFHPASTGSKSAMVTISGSGNNLPLIVPITGTGQ